MYISKKAFWNKLQTVVSTPTVTAQPRAAFCGQTAVSSTDAAEQGMGSIKERVLIEQSVDYSIRNPMDTACIWQSGPDAVVQYY